MQTYQTEGIILHSLKFQDYDQIVTAYTPNYGLIKLFVKGALRPKYNHGALTTPLSRVEFIFRRGKSELLVCQEISMLNPYLILRQQIDRLEAAFDMLQALNMSQMAQAPAPDLYKLFVIYLDKLAAHDDPWVLALSFRLKILRHEGHLGLSQSCSSCQIALQNLYVHEGECYCRHHAPTQSLEFEADESALLYVLTHSRTHSQLVPLRVEQPLRHKVKLLFQSMLM